MTRATRFARLAAATAILAALVALPARAGDPTFYVNGATGLDTNACMSATSACKTIQAAINKASSGDTIIVAAGIYPEGPGPLAVNKSLTLQGAQSGVDARSRSGAESVITDSQGTSVSAGNVVIDGFTVQGSTNAAFTGYGIWLNPGVSGTQIVNDIIQDNIVGIGLANTGAQAVIEHDLIQNNNEPGGASGDGIYTDEFVGGPTTSNVLVTQNSFKGNNDAGIDMSNTDFAHGVSDLEVTDNAFDMNGRGVLFFNTHDSIVDGNSITRSTLAGSAAVRLFDNNGNIGITNNDLIGGAMHGIRLGTLFAMPSSSVAIHENNIENFPGDGLLVDDGSHVGTVDATCNWWNSASGPMNPNNPGGTGEPVVGDADFMPWLIAPAPNGPCHGAVSTPGKVTGGGQVQGDPVFSASATLLSAPATTSSAAGPTGKATFGFVVQCCTPRGNLEYDDHAAGVSIKAKSIDSLVISSPGSSCTATPGSEHAEFTGTASVTRSTGTTNEPFTVDVDDCGEPGATDTFKIQTTTYSNEGTLLGGNIQIHKQ